MKSWGTASLCSALLVCFSPFLAADEESLGCGTGVVTAVAPMGGECVAFTPAQGGGPDNYEIQEGGTYSMTISGVTECEGDTITIFIQSSESGNFCFNAVGVDGEYTGVFSVPDATCNTMPISYKCGADAECTNSGSFSAQGPSSGCGGVHLRSALFDEGCEVIGTDVDCPPCPEPAASEMLGAPCDSLLTITPPVQGGSSTAVYDGNVPGGIAFFFYSPEGIPFVFQGCDIYLDPPFHLGAFIVLDGDGNGQVTVPNNQHPCGQEIVVQSFVINAVGVQEVSNAVRLTFGS